jgi:hypothetical protein
MDASNELDDRLRTIVLAVGKRVQERVDSIDPMFRFLRTGIEAWFKVETVAALDLIGDKVISLNNKGPDLTLAGGLLIELKGATDFNPIYLMYGALKDGVPCLFLGSGENRRNIEQLNSMSQIRVIGYEFPKGIHTWAVGCIVPA